MTKKIVKSLGITILVIFLFLMGLTFMLAPLSLHRIVNIDPLKQLLVSVLWMLFWSVFSITLVIQYRKE